MSTAYQSIQLDIQGAVARLTLARPDKMNSVTTAMHAELRDALQRVQADRAVRVLVLGAQGKGFCAGQDLADPAVRFVPPETPPDLGDLVEYHYKPLVLQLRALRVPTIAAVQGIAAGAGIGIALSCDLVIAADSASFMLPFAKIGLVPDTGCTWLIAQRIGHARAMGLALTGQRLSARDAVQWGLIWQSVPDAEFAAAIDRQAAQLCELPTHALVRTRQVFQAAQHHTLEEHLGFEAQNIRELGRSADYIEGVSAFLEKRPAKFNRG